ncbi:MAG: hypothetical protein PHQ04_01910 [Opitutaceae bacterium]|nr:hypothetical protein [Opitutaceae bacterium]
MFKHQARSGVLLNFYESHVQLARVAKMEEQPLSLDSFCEVDAGDEEGLNQWLQTTFPERRAKNLVPGICGFHPQGRVLVRDNLVLRRLGEPEYLRGLVAQHAGVSSASEWCVSALHPSEGFLLPSEGAPRPGLLFGLPLASVREMQHRLLRLGIRPRRLELDSLALLGGLMRLLVYKAYPHAGVVCEIEQEQTRVFILGKDGVHTPPSFPHGLLSLVESAEKILMLEDHATALRELGNPSENLRSHSRRLVRMISRHLRPAIDYYELQTGQRVGALLCAQLPSKLTWLGEALAAAVDLESIAVDLATWLPTVNVQLTDAPPALNASWLPVFSLAANLTPAVHESKS